MIRDMIAKLMEEANEEAEHKGWCDAELATNEQTIDMATDATRCRFRRLRLSNPVLQTRLWSHPAELRPLSSMLDVMGDWITRYASK